MQFTIEGYENPGTFTPTSFTVSKTVGNEGFNAEDCSTGTIQVIDGNPGHGFPKAMEFIINCPSLRNSNTHTCTPPLALNLRLDCE